ncbi:MAG TPA: HAMP domain-containing protein [bacterium]|nr:HAMP domain-containing protein [bacterium]
MRLFFIGLAAALLILSAFCTLLWRRHRDRARFQTRLTILFLLFGLAPVVPLIFLSASLFTQSARLLFMPGVGEALETALGTLRTGLEEDGFRFLETHPDQDAWNPDLLARHRIAWGGWMEREDESPHVVRAPDCALPDGWIPDKRLFSHTLSKGRSSRLVRVGDREWLSVAGRRPDSSAAVLMVAIPRPVVEAKEKISGALTAYNALSLLKESLIQKNRIWSAAILTLALLALFAVFAARSLSRGVSEPIRGLVAGMREAAEGDLSARVAVRARGEFRFLVDAFNGMLSDLEAARRKLIEAERVTARQEAARRISHEIRNSLTPIAVSLRNLRNIEDERQADPRLMKQLDAIEEEFKSLRNLAAEFADFARMPRPDKTRIRLNETIRSVVRLMEETAGNIQIETRLSDDLPEIDADREQIRRMLGNLLQNAIEASPARPAISVATSLSGDGKTIGIEICDRGEGMDPETAARVFDPYFTTRPKGTGLGLAIVRKIADEHQGDIRIESRKDEGTRVTIRFPLPDVGSPSRPGNIVKPSPGSGCRSPRDSDRESTQ